MIIRLAILEHDSNYLNKIVAVFNARYADKFEIYSFTEKNLALSVIEKERIDIFVADEKTEFEEHEIPRNCAFAYLTDRPDVEAINGKKAICKFQKIESIYREIIGLYAENTEKRTTFKLDEDGCKVLLFSSPVGGAGTSSLAAGLSLKLAREGKKVLYLNLEKLGSADIFFHAEGAYDMSDVLFALKSSSQKLAFKLESCVKTDQRGVHFFSQSKYALDMEEVSYEEYATLIEGLRSSGFYEYIILDMDFELDREYLKLYEIVNRVIWTDTGTDIANNKIYRAYEACRMIAQEGKALPVEKIALIYNKFSNKSCKIIDDELGVRSIGGAPKFVNLSSEEIAGQLSGLGMLSSLL